MTGAARLMKHWLAAALESQYLPVKHNQLSCTRARTKSPAEASLVRRELARPARSKLWRHLARGLHTPESLWLRHGKGSGLAHHFRFPPNWSYAFVCLYALFPLMRRRGRVASMQNSSSMLSVSAGRPVHTHHPQLAWSCTPASGRHRETRESSHSRSTCARRSWRWDAGRAWHWPWPWCSPG